MKSVLFLGLLFICMISAQQCDNIRIFAQSTAPSCYSSKDGSITITASGGVAPYEYSVNGVWSSNNLFSSLAPGAYSVRAKDSMECDSNSITIIVSSPPPIDVSVSVTQPTCSAPTGTAAVFAVGGTSAIQYSVVPAGSPPVFVLSNSFTSLQAGTYSVVVRDDNNCQSSSVFQILAIGC